MCQQLGHCTPDINPIKTILFDLQKAFDTVYPVSFMTTTHAFNAIAHECKNTKQKK